MTAVGVTYSGEKEILGFERTSLENESNWRGFLAQLVSRGLTPSELGMVISDEHRWTAQSGLRGLCATRPISCAGLIAMRKCARL